MSEDKLREIAKKHMVGIRDGSQDQAALRLFEAMREYAMHRVMTVTVDAKEQEALAKAERDAAATAEHGEYVDNLREDLKTVTDDYTDCTVKLIASEKREAKLRELVREVEAEWNEYIEAALPNDWLARAEKAEKV